MMSESTDAVHAAQIDASLEELKKQITGAQTALRNGEHHFLLQSMQAIDQHVDGLKIDAVMRARRWGVSWFIIGSCFGMSKQAAWLRYGNPTGE